VLAELVRRPKSAIVVCFVRGDDNAHARRHSSDASIVLLPPPRAPLPLHPLPHATALSLLLSQPARP
jgi:hypothetical protein